MSEEPAQVTVDAATVDRRRPRTARRAAARVGRDGPARRSSLDPVAIGVIFMAALLVACDEHEPAADLEACEREGVLCVVAGLIGQAGRGNDGLPPDETPLYLPQDVTVARDGIWWIADYNNHVIREVGADGATHVIAGSGFPGGAQGGPALTEPMDHPTMVVQDPYDSDILWIAATGNHRVGRLQRSEGVLTFPYGTGEATFMGDGGPASRASFHRPSSLAVDRDGAMMVSDRMNQIVRRIDTNGVITTLVGVPLESGYAGDGGPASEARLNAPPETEMDPGNRLDLLDDRLAIADSGNGVVRLVDLSTRIIETALDGLDRPHDVAIGADGTIFVADTGASCVRALPPTGGATVVAGRCGEPGPAAAAVNAVEAALDYPCGVFVDERGFLWIADTRNHVIRRVRIDDVSGAP